MHQELPSSNVTLLQVLLQLVLSINKLENKGLYRKYWGINLKKQQIHFIFIFFAKIGYCFNPPQKISTLAYILVMHASFRLVRT